MKVCLISLLRLLLPLYFLGLFSPILTLAAVSAEEKKTGERGMLMIQG